MNQMTSHSEWADQLCQRMQTQGLQINPAQILQTFSPAYRHHYSIEEAWQDWTALQQCLDKDSLKIRHYRPQEVDEGIFHIKFLVCHEPLTLSRMMPWFDAMGLEVLGEHPFKVQTASGSSWIHDFRLRHERVDFVIDDILNLLQQVFREEVDVDGFNQLVLSAGLNSKQVLMLRSYAAYMKQMRQPWTRERIIETLIEHAAITRLLVAFFMRRFQPGDTDTDSAEQTRERILESIDAVSALDQDQILRQYLNLIEATVRCNFFQDNPASRGHALAFKINSSQVENLPQPLPRFEIYCYSNAFEGIHLRGALVARGGLRWSERKDDFRTEVLGLMKAQMTKNAVIVPSGSKGGFIVKRFSPAGNKQEQIREAYQWFIRSLLSLTDNREGDAVVHPPQTRIHDEVDPYLVVAADKGTATFSDTANRIAEEQGFWLGDAFASGGSAGYDHKKMGITARGAWISVQRHFRERGKDIQTQPFSVLGIGDMSGDVFGNGLLLSKQIRLQAAFNHLHIFIDPNPDPASSWDERKRLFELPRSQWSDYNSTLISQGGGVFSRAQKRIPLSTEIQQLIATERSSMSPDELIHHLLKSEIELLWNGGIGTYIKAASESHAEVQDKANDALRVDAKDLRFSVIGEGGNLGLTAAARVEFCQNGGEVYADSIDNSAGVDCSDHEVNIKIALGRAETKGLLSREQRNQLLEEMTDNVAHLVLQHNYTQTQIISMIESDAALLMHEHGRFMRHLENLDVLNRALERLPDEAEVATRLAAQQGLTKPEIGLLLAFSKLTYKNALLDSSLPDQEDFNQELQHYFPTPLQHSYREEWLQHPLRREIISTRLANRIVDHVGPGFSFRMREELGSNIAGLTYAYQCVMQLFDLETLWNEVEALDNQVNAQVQILCLKIISGFLQRDISWLLRERQPVHASGVVVQRFAESADYLSSHIETHLSGLSQEIFDHHLQQLLKQQVPESLAIRIARLVPLSSALDISHISLEKQSPLASTAKLYFQLGDELDIHWLREQISALKSHNHWQQLAITGLRNQVHLSQRRLCSNIIGSAANSRFNFEDVLEDWQKQQEFRLQRYHNMLAEMRAHRSLDFPMLSLLSQELSRF